MGIAEEIVETMEKLGYKHQKLDDCGNNAFLRDFEHGYIQVVEYFEDAEMFRAPLITFHQEVLVQIYDMLGDVIYAHRTHLYEFVTLESIRIENKGG